MAEQRESHGKAQALLSRDNFDLIWMARQSSWLHASRRERDCCSAGEDGEQVDSLGAGEAGIVVLNQTPFMQRAVANMEIMAQ